MMIGSTLPPIGVIGSTLPPIGVIGSTLSPIMMIGSTLSPIMMIGSTLSPIMMIGSTLSPIMMIGFQDFTFRSMFPSIIQLGVISALFRIKLTLMLWLNEYKLLLGVENSLDFDDIDGICPSVALADFEGDFVAFI
jgi:hypothetical protein